MTIVGVSIFPEIHNIHRLIPVISLSNKFFLNFCHTKPNSSNNIRNEQVAIHLFNFNRIINRSKISEHLQTVVQVILVGGELGSFSLPDSRILSSRGGSERVCL